jgi:hypothetical protein
VLTSTSSVYGNADTKYLADQSDDRDKRNAIGTYAKSGLSQYTVEAPGVSYNTGANFPLNWTPRYAIAAGVVAFPDRREDFQAHDSPRNPSVEHPVDGYYADPKDSTAGFTINGTLPTTEGQGVHSLTDVPVYAMGPCQELFSGVYNNIDMFYKMAECFGLGLPSDGSDECKAKPGKGKGRRV